MTVAVFDYTTWAIRFPELAVNVSSTLAQLYFSEACLMLDNTDDSIVTDASVRLTLLNLLTAHIAYLQNPTSNIQLTGRVNQAQEGSVKIGSSASVTPFTQEWYFLSKYGQAYYMMTAQYRTSFYCAGDAYIADPYQALMGIY